MNEQDNLDEKMKERLHQIFPSPHVASAMVDAIVHNRPAGWSRKSNAPYYKEIYGKQMKADIDKMIVSGKDLVFRYETWCDETFGMTPNTLYCRVNQSIRYVIEQMDADGKYRNWYERVRITREPKNGVVIRFIAGLSDINPMSADIIEPKDEGRHRWLHRMDEWLESDDTIPFCAEGLAMSPEEMDKVRIQLQQLVGIQYSIRSESVKIIKTNE
jgi:hypothetical protein